MNTIWKYLVGGHSNRRVLMPEGAKILSAGVQGKDIYVWAFVDVNVGKEVRCIDIYGTGGFLGADPGTFIGTVHMPNGEVYHVFEGVLI